MPSNKFFGKSKEDLILLATLGRVLTLDQAREMTQADLAEFLSIKDLELDKKNTTQKTKESREKAPLAMKNKISETPQTGNPEKPEARAASKVKSTEKLSKREQNKQQFMQELATIGASADPAAILPAKKAESEAETDGKSTSIGKGRGRKAKPAPADESVGGNGDTESDDRKMTEGSAESKTDRKAAKTGRPKKAKETEPTAAQTAAEAKSVSETGSANAEEPAKAAEPVNAPEPIKETEPAKETESAKETIMIQKTGSEEVTGESSQAVKPKVRITRRKIKEAEPEAISDGQPNDAKTTDDNGTTGEDAPQGDASNPAAPSSEKHHRHAARIPAATEEYQGDAASGEEGEHKRHEKVAQAEVLEMVEGVLEVMPDGYGFLRKNNYLQSPKDIYIPPQYIRRFGLRPGDLIVGPGKLQRETDRYQAILYIKEVNGLPPEKMVGRPQFDQLTPIYPNERFVLETVKNELSTRIIDLVAPIGKGQRGMIVSPPKAGKTILLQKIANAISINNPEAKLIVLLIDERPEEVTDMQRSINGEVVYSTFDKTPENHVKIVELVLERAMRLVELGQDVVILLDSITRLARAYNLTINPTGRTLSGGLDPGALYGPKRFFGSARNIENGGSLTIIATSLIDTGSRMDEVIFEEFKGTGNMEVYLDRKLSEKRIFPAIDLNRSGTRREELLLSKRELDAVWTIRKAFGQLDTAAVTEMIINLLLKTNHNSHFVSSVNVSLNDKAMFDAMRGTKPSGGQGGGSGSNGQSYGGSSYGSGSGSSYGSGNSGGF